MNLVWSPLALERIQEIVDYMEQNDSRTTIHWIDGLFDAVTRLQIVPSSGRIVPEIKRQGVREIFYSNYRDLYRVSQQEISILTIFHTRQLFEPGEMQESEHGKKHRLFLCIRSDWYHRQGKYYDPIYHRRYFRRKN